MVADRSSRTGGGVRQAMVDMNITERIVPVWGSRLDMTVQVAGDGPPLVYLHAAGGMVWDPFLERLSADYTIYAPLVPGTVPGKKEAIREVADLWDLVLVYEETIGALNLDRPPVVGQSFGGMLACELAAHSPDALQPAGAARSDRSLARRPSRRELGRSRARPDSRHCSSTIPMVTWRVPCSRRPRTPMPPSPRSWA